MSYIHEEIAFRAYNALVMEASATPKPGLVDVLNSGAHQDMNYFTFLDSAEALRPHFAAMAAEGMNTAADPVSVLFSELRQMGRLAERDMYRATGGVNTHKGALFSLGLLCGAAGRHYALTGEYSPEAACAIVAEMSQGICEAEFSGLEAKESLTKGEQMYLEYGVTGARGQAEIGYFDVLSTFLPYYQSLRDGGMGEDEICCRTLLEICATITDTNILSRADMKTAERAKAMCRAVLKSYSYENMLQLDRDFIEMNISPGGCADLLAVTIFLDLLDQPLDKQ